MEEHPHPSRNPPPIAPLPQMPGSSQADQVFLSIDHHPDFSKYGADEPAHIPFYALGGAYHQPENDLMSLPREVILKNIHHRNFMIAPRPPRRFGQPMRSMNWKNS